MKKKYFIYILIIILVIFLLYIFITNDKITIKN